MVIVPSTRATFEEKYVGINQKVYIYCWYMTEYENASTNKCRISSILHVRPSDHGHFVLKKYMKGLDFSDC